ncbi:MAG: PAS domain-containing protein [Algicola sp.]|nr:PAS domain-containing protein [Algicola sp.]
MTDSKEKQRSFWGWTLAIGLLYIVLAWMFFHYQPALFSVVAAVMLTTALLGYYAGHIRTQNQHQPVAQRLQQTEQSLQTQLTLNQLCHDMVLNWHINDDQVTVQIGLSLPFTLDWTQSIAHISDWYEKVHPDDITGLEQQMQNLIKSSDLHCSAQYRVLLSEGYYVLIIEHCVVQRNEHNEALHMLRVINDISAQKAQLANLERQCQAQKIKALITLVDGVAHDHNNVLAVISGFIELLELKVVDNQDLQYYVDQLAQASSRGRQQGDKLLAYSRRRRIGQVEVVFDQAVSGMIERLRAGLSDSISVETALRSDGARVLLDSEQLETALGNLITNSAEAMSQHGVIWLTSQIVTLSADEAQSLQLDAGQWLVFVVKDDGCGINDTAVSQIFDPYYSNTSGTGLGLSQVYGFVQCSHGAIDVSSKPDKGCKIWVYLPLR